MLRNLLLSAFFIFSFSSSFAGPAVLVEEDGVPIRPLSRGPSIKETYQGQEFSSVYELREKRRLGVGTQIAGVAGLYGVFTELNINPSNSGMVGFGGGPGYSSFFGSWKYVMSENRFSPYTGLGFAHWYDAMGGNETLQKSNPRFLGSRLLTKKEKDSGQFQMDLLTADFGFQYQILKGSYTGLSFFGEIDLMMRTTTLSLAPTGTLGSTYYF